MLGATTVMAPTETCTLYGYVATYCRHLLLLSNWGQTSNHLYYRSNTYETVAVFVSKSSSSMGIKLAKQWKSHTLVHDSPRRHSLAGFATFHFANTWNRTSTHKETLTTTQYTKSVLKIDLLQKHFFTKVFTKCISFENQYIKTRKNLWLRKF
jgi:hypothetical protein